MVFNKARALLLHAAIHWPETTQDNLWPFAVDYAIFLWNNTPRMDSGLSPLDLLSGTKGDCHLLHNTRVWGCPVYVLDPKLQDGHKIPKWKP